MNLQNTIGMEGGTDMGKDWPGIIRTVSSCHTLQDFADKAVELIGNPVIFFDAHLAVAACTEIDIEDDNYRHLRRYHYPPESLMSDPDWRSSINALLRNSGSSSADAGEYLNLNHLHRTLYAGDNLVGQIDSPSHFRPFTEEDQEVLDLIAPFCTVLLQNRMSRQVPLISGFDYYLESLLDGENLVSEDAAASALARMDWRPAQNLSVLCMDLNLVVTEYQREQLAAALLPEDRILRYRNHLVGILSRTKPLSREDLRNMDQRFRILGYSCGLSRPFSRITEVRKYYKEAEKVLDMVSRLGRAGGVYPYDGYLEYVMISGGGSSPDPEQNVLPGLMELAEKDRAHGHVLLDTLLCYFDSGRSVSTAAERLNVHRNTVNYRVDFCMKQLDLDPSDGRQMLRLYNSLLILEYTDRERWFS